MELEFYLPLPVNTQPTQQTNIYAPWRDSNPQSQQASCRRPTPYIARPPDPAFGTFLYLKYEVRQ